MSEGSGPLTNEKAPVRAISHKRLLVTMSVLIVAGSIAGAIFGSGRSAAGILVGGALAFANYFWQRNSTRALFDRTAAGERPVMLGVRYIFRYVLIGLVVAFFYITDALPIVAVVIGLAAFSFAVVVEGIFGILAGSFNTDD